MKYTLSALLLPATLALAEGDYGPGGGFGGHGGGPGAWGGMPWGDNDWNWGGHGGAPKPGAPVPTPNACPPGAPPPGVVAPFQPLFNQHFENSPPGEHWEQMCPRDKGRGDLYIPVQCGTERKGCCTWRATATKLSNSVWACCPCGASCTGVAPGFGYEWTENQPVPTPVGWTQVGGGQFPLTAPGPPAPYTTTFLANGGTSISTIYPGPIQTPYPGALPFSAPGALPTAYTTWSNGVATTVTGFTQPTCSAGAFCPLPQYPNGQVIGPPGANGQGSWTWTSATTKNGKTYPASWVQITGTKTTPVSVCNVNGGKTSCSVLSTTAVGCSLGKNGNQVCSTSRGPVMQTVNAAPTNVAGVGAGVVAAALGFAYALA